MKQNMRHFSSQVHSAQQNAARKTQSRETYTNANRAKQYQQRTSNYYMHTANAVARDYVYEEEVKKTPQKQKQVVEKRRVPVAKYIVALVLVCLMGLSLVMQNTVIQDLGYKVSKVQTELRSVNDANEKIRKQIAVLGELKTVEAIAIYNLGMRKPVDGDIIYLPEIPQETKADSANAAQ